MRNESEDKPCIFTAIDPYPKDVLIQGLSGLNEIIIDKVQNVQFPYNKMTAGDILFVDSTHVVKIGGDINHIFFDVLPTLNPGVLIHFHDIFLPEEYPRDWIFLNHWFWSEQYLLQAFLMHNSEYEILWAGNYMRLFHSEELEKIFPSFKERKPQPGSFWIRKL